jgi:hypothetical protein
VAAEVAGSAIDADAAGDHLGQVGSEPEGHRGAPAVPGDDHAVQTFGVAQSVKILDHVLE